jgi:hypothetical protein
VEPENGVADDGRVGHVVDMAVTGLDRPHMQGHATHRGGVRAVPQRPFLEAVPGVGAGVGHQLGVPRNLDVLP